MDSTLGSIGFEQRARNVAGTLADFAQIRPASTHISLLTILLTQLPRIFFELVSPQSSGPASKVGSP